MLERKGQRELVLARCKEPVGEVIAKMKSGDVSQLPVVGERDQLLGIVTEVGLLSYLLSQPGSKSSKVAIEDAGVIDSNVYTLNPETPIKSVMSVFGTNDIALVTEHVIGSDDKRVVGILTKIDLLDFLTKR